MNWGLHRTGECGEPHCIAVFNEEMALEYPSPLFKRNALYDRQRIQYYPWTNNVAAHRWSFRLDGTCRNCEADGPTIQAGKMQLCIRWCLMTLLPWYPTGESQILYPEMMLHAKSCTFHSSSQTSKLIAYLESLSGQYSPMSAELRSKSTFFLGQRKTPEPSFSRMLSLNLDLLTRTPPNFDIPKR
jgi:hypothetical protein